MAAVDIDETLIGPDRRVGRANRRALERLQELGCRVLLASGRRHANMVPYYEELGLDDFVVSSQGARVEHVRTGEVLYRARLGAAEASALAAEGLRRGFGILYWLDDRVAGDRPSQWVAAYEKLCDDPVSIEDLGPLAGHDSEKVVWLGEPAVVAETAEAVRAELDGRALVTITERWSLEFAAPTANKRDGVAAAAGRLGVPREAVLAFGDGNNDAALLAWAGLGVAMPHGRSSARAAARLVAPEGDPESALARGVDAILRDFEGVCVA